MRVKSHNIAPPVALMPYKPGTSERQREWHSHNKNTSNSGNQTFSENEDIRTWDPDTLIVLDRSEPEDEARILDETLHVDSAVVSRSNIPQSKALQPAPVSRTLRRIRVYKSANARVRFFARAFDLYWQIALLQIGALKALELMQPSLVLPPIDNLKAQLAVIFLLLPLALLIDSLWYSIFGNTPGKALLGIKIFRKDKSRVTFWRMLRRNTSLWVSGLACGVPGPQVFTFYRQYMRIQALKRTRYDRKLDLWVGAKKSSYLRAFSFLTASILVVLSVQAVTQDSRVNQYITAKLPDIRRTVTQVFLDQVGIGSYLSANTIIDPDKASSPAMTRRNEPAIRQETLWSNPATQLSTAISQYWVASTSAENPDSYQFDWIHSDKRLIKLSLKADKSGLSDVSDIGRTVINDAPLALSLDNTALQYEYDGRSYWEYRGHPDNQLSVTVIVQVAKIDQGFWIIETLLDSSDKTLLQEAEKLAASIWATW